MAARDAEPLTQSDEDLSELSDEYVEPRRGLPLRGPGVLILAVAALLGAAAYFRPSRATAQSQSQLNGVQSELNGVQDAETAGPAAHDLEPEQRLLESDELLETTVTHALLFHKMAGGQELSKEDADSAQLKLMDAARVEITKFMAHVERSDPEVARQLRELRLSRGDWDQTHKVLAALHDKRVLELGQSVVETAKEGAGDREKVRRLLTERLGERSRELQALKDELIPASLHDVPAGPDGRSHWEVAVDAAGGLELHGSVEGWATDVRMQAPIAERRLSSGVGFEAVIHVVTGTLGLIISAIISVITTTMTLIKGARVAKIFWGTQGVLDLTVCGLTFGAMTPWLNWLPCMVMSLFFGLEAIWTFQKPAWS